MQSPLLLLWPGRYVYDSSSCFWINMGIALGHLPFVVNLDASGSGSLSVTAPDVFAGATTLLFQAALAERTIVNQPVRVTNSALVWIYPAL